MESVVEHAGSSGRDGGVARTADTQLAELLEEASGYPGPETEPATARDVVVPLRLVVAGDELSFFSIASSVVSATDVTVDDLHIEAFYPADAATAEALRPS